MYGSFSYFSGKTAEKEIKLLDVSKFFRILYKKKHLKKPEISTGIYRWKKS